ncbi:MAG: hypothetical protein AB7U41_06260 [Dongiaceae bacterium]
MSHGIHLSVLAFSLKGAIEGISGDERLKAYKEGMLRPNFAIVIPDFKPASGNGFTYTLL